MDRPTATPPAVRLHEAVDRLASILATLAQRQSQHDAQHGTLVDSLERLGQATGDLQRYMLDVRQQVADLAWAVERPPALAWYQRLRQAWPMAALHAGILLAVLALAPWYVPSGLPPAQPQQQAVYAALFTRLDTTILQYYGKLPTEVQQQLEHVYERYQVQGPGQRIVPGK
jgi:hypothetical protein